MLVCFEKTIEKIEEISKIYWQFWKVFKKNLEVLENFNKMYTIMYAFHCFVKEKHCTTYINCVHNRIFPKIWGPNALLASPRVKSGGMAPWSPCGGPHDIYG